MTANNRPPQTNTTGEKLHKVRLWHIWQGMHDRCYNPNKNRYHNYGAKGIRVCEEWNRDNPNGYENFRQWSMEHGYAEDLTIDRIDSTQDYTPLNCRWTDYKTQGRNTSRNHPVTVNGKEYKTLSEACEAYGRTEDCEAIRGRIYISGWTPERAFNEPVAKHSITVNGTTYTNLAEACEALKLNYKTVTAYKYRHNTTAEEAIAHYTEGADR